MDMNMRRESFTWVPIAIVLAQGYGMAFGGPSEPKVRAGFAFSYARGKSDPSVPVRCAFILSIISGFKTGMLLLQYVARLWRFIQHRRA